MSATVFSGATDTGTGGTTITLDLSSALSGADNTVVIVWIYTDASALPTLTSNNGYTPGTPVNSGAVTTNDRRTGQLWYKDVVDSLVEEVAPTWTASGTLGDWNAITEIISGLVIPSNMIGENSRVSASAGTMSTPAVTPTSGKKAFAFAGYGVNTAVTATNSEFTGETLSGTNAGATTEHLSAQVGLGSSTGITTSVASTPITSTSGAYTGTATITTQDVGVAALVIFEVAPPPTPQLAADQPQATGLLSRIFKGKRILAANQPASSAVLLAHHVFTRALSANQPATTATLLLKRLRSLAANQPAPTATLTRIATPKRTLAADQPSATTALTRILGALRTLAADQPAATGVVTVRVITTSRILAADQPSATAAVTYISHRVRSLAANQPAATATLTRSKTSVRSLTANQLSGSATLTRRAQTTRSLTANQPAPTAGILGPAIYTLFNQVLRWLKGGRL